jgi:DNA (cytosine-5)-methyltransferase 1
MPLAWHGRGLEIGKENIAYAVRSGGDGHTGDQMGYIMSLAVAGDFSDGLGDAQPVRAANGQPGCVGDATAVRRLTPLECERLQGFPDEWTRRDADGAEQSDSARYRRLGNAVAVPVVEWIARRIVAADSLLAADTTPAEDGGEAA